MTRSSDLLAVFLRLMSRSLIAAAGAALATGAGVLLLVLLAIDATAGRANPYFGILAFLVLPAIFVLGLLLIPLGAWRSSLRRRDTPEGLPSLAHDRPMRRRLALVGVATLANIAILTTATFRAVEVMDTKEFCGQTCHAAMAPEATAAPFAPHARVLCVSCHVGPGAGGFLRAKLNGVSQLAHLITGTHQRPILVPLEGSSPAREVCLDCHAISRFEREKLRIIRSFASDATSTPSTTVLMLRIGGPSNGRNTARGIHWHVSPENVVEFRSADRKRSVITRVRARLADGTTREYAAAASFGQTPEDGTSTGADGEWHRMDCVDCHNRPAHTLEQPGRAVDAALADGRLSRSLPWIRKNALEVLTAEYRDKTAALETIPRRIMELYPSGPDPDAREAGQVLSGIYARNVFPEMRVGWGTYPNHIGHTDSPGCFRCHDGAHTTSGGEAITSDCSACHTLLAVEEAAPEVLKTLYPEPGPGS